MNGHELNDQPKSARTSTDRGTDTPGAGAGPSDECSSNEQGLNVQALNGRQTVKGRVAGHILSRPVDGLAAPRHAGALVLESTAFGALGWVARGDVDVPLPRLERVAAGKVRLMALVDARRAATARPGLALASN